VHWEHQVEDLALMDVRQPCNGNVNLRSWLLWMLGSCALGISS